MKFDFSKFLIGSFLVINLALGIFAMFIPKGIDVLVINGMHTPFLDFFFSAITNLGSGLVLLPLLVWSLFQQFRLTMIVALASASHGIIVTIFKHLLFPFMLRPAAVIDPNLIHFVSGIDVHKTHSFPSGHTATIFLATFLICYLLKSKSATIILITLALLVGISRVYLVQHFLMDVAAGSLIGTMCGVVAVVLLGENGNHPVWMRQRLELKLSNPKPAAAK